MSEPADNGTVALLRWEQAVEEMSLEADEGLIPVADAGKKPASALDPGNGMERLPLDADFCRDPRDRLPKHRVFHCTNHLVDP